MNIFIRQKKLQCITFLQFGKIYTSLELHLKKINSHKSFFFKDYVVPHGTARREWVNKKPNS